MGLGINRRAGRGLAILLVAATGAFDTARAEDCGTSGLDDQLVGPSIGGADWTVNYTDDSFLNCNSSGHYLSDTIANKIQDTINSAYDRQGTDWGFTTPYSLVLPDFGIYVFDSDDTGTNNRTCVTLDAPIFRCASDNGITWVTSHEIFHGIQRQYDVNGGADGKMSFGAWFTEGTARCLDDRYTLGLDASGPLITEVNRLMGSDHDDLGPYRDLSLTQLSYRAALWWSYCCEQLGVTNIEPDSGVDFVRELWENAEEDLTNTGERDGLATTDRTIEEMGGGSMHGLFHDFAICLYTREFDATGLPNPDRYLFVDETPAGLNGGDIYDDMTRTAVVDGTQPLPPGPGLAALKSYGHRYYELTPISPPGTGVCEAIGMRGGSLDNVSWSLVGVKAPAATGLPEQATHLSKAGGKSYARAFLHSFEEPFTRLGAVVVGRGSDTIHSYQFGRGPASIAIIRPTADEPAYPGPFNAPDRILVRVQVNGPDSLKPFSGPGIVSIAGLRSSDFAAKIGTANAPILNLSYVGGEYWLVVQAPNQAANGAYDLTVQICPTATLPPTSIKVSSVVYGNFTVNHMLVVDRSGSMLAPEDGSGTKLDAAKNAATLYVDSVKDSDRIGFVWFSADNSECNNDAFLQTPLALATPAQRTAARNGINGLAAAGRTSIGDGLWEAQDELDALPPGPDQVKTIVLLSDGEENEARFWNSTIPCVGDLGDSARSRIEPSDTMVNAIAFGPEANQSLMQTIGTQTDGDYSYVDVTEGGRGAGLSEISTLADAYMKMLQRNRKLERLFFHAGNATGGVTTQLDVPVEEGGVDQGTFFVNWPAAAGASTVELRDPSNNVIGAAQATIYTTATHRVYHVNGTLATGTWRIRFTPTNGTEFVAGLLGRQRTGVQLLAAASPTRTGGASGLADLGRFEQGVPVVIVAIPTDRLGKLTGATIEAVVTRPDGSTACGNLVLRDDGTQEDGEADDGVYAGVFTDTMQAGSINGVDNDQPGNISPGGPRGTYRAHVVATGQSNTAEPFNRSADVYFHVYSLTLNDLDGDGLPDTWEKFYQTSLGANDAAIDRERDGLTNLQEFQNGTDPDDQDTDDGGETDASEVAGGRCPRDPSDDLLPCPEDVEVVDDTGDLDESILMPLANLLRFPVHPSYQKMRIFRANEGNPTLFSVIAEHAIAGPNDATYYDNGLADGATYFYRFQAVGAGESTSCMSPTVQGTARLHPVQPLGWVTINTDSEQTDSVNVLVTLNLTTGADKYRISNTPLDGTEPLLNLPSSPYLNWVLNPPAAGRNYTQVYVQYVNTAHGTDSYFYQTRIRFDPAGDFDNDTVANALDPDDDNDGLPDSEEIYVWYTNAYKADSDEDGLSDGEEVAGGCTHPRNPDSDGDDLPDGIDPSPSGDTDADGDVDLFDVAKFQVCFTGEGGGPVLAVCVCLDADGDDDIDLADYEAFSAGLIGP